MGKLPISEYNSATKPLLRSANIPEHLIPELFPKNGVYLEKGFLSTTHSEQAFKSWLQKNPSHNVMFKVFGKNGKLIEEVAQDIEEAEVLFRSKTKFEIISVDIVKHPIRTGDLIYEIILKEI